MWTEEYLIGEKQIDEQHKELLLLLGSTMEALGNPETSREYYRTALEAAKGALVKHFNTEEKYFQVIGFTEAEYHTKLHKNFFEKTGNFEIELIKTEYDPAVVLRLVEMLIEWFTGHILGEDKKMGDPAYWSNQEETPRFQL